MVAYERNPTPDFATTYPQISEDEPESDRPPTSLQDFQKRNDRTLRNISRQERRHAQRLKIEEQIFEHREKEDSAKAEAEEQERQRAERISTRAKKRRALQRLVDKKVEESQQLEEEAQISDHSAAAPKKKKARLTRGRRPFLTEGRGSDSDSENQSNGKPTRELEERTVVVKKKNYAPPQAHEIGFEDGVAEASKNKPNQKKKSATNKEKAKEQPSTACVKAKTICTKQQGGQTVCFPCFGRKKKCSLASTADPMQRLSEAIDRLSIKLETGDQSFDEKADRFQTWLKEQSNELVNREAEKAELRQPTPDFAAAEPVISDDEDLVTLPAGADKETADKYFAVLRRNLNRGSRRAEQKWRVDDLVAAHRTKQEEERKQFEERLAEEMERAKMAEMKRAEVAEKTGERTFVREAERENPIAEDTNMQCPEEAPEAIQPGNAEESNQDKPTENDTNNSGSTETTDSMAVDRPLPSAVDPATENGFDKIVAAIDRRTSQESECTANLKDLVSGIKAGFDSMAGEYRALRTEIKALVESNTAIAQSVERWTEELLKKKEREQAESSNRNRKEKRSLEEKSTTPPASKKPKM
ncbi:hypothetical protein VNI00_006308 [Paramarasmius palmivorus]|uniref:Uncharacterized protein n=1 Tax=Paramarasmius palmivorus TaxID=297713 RepID=A0AAW0D7S3_9AGAR